MTNRERANEHTVGDLLICDVSGCTTPALARVYPTNGQTDNEALRCRDCLEYDLGRGWFMEWEAAIFEDREVGTP